MPDINELSIKVSVLETEYENMVKTLDRLEKNLEGNSALVSQIKERLDKQNGLIPHMAESIKDMHSCQQELIKKLTANTIKDSAMNVKVKLMWGLVTALAGGLLYALLRIYVG